MPFTFFIISDGNDQKVGVGLHFDVARGFAGLCVRDAKTPLLRIIA